MIERWISTNEGHEGKAGCYGVDKPRPFPKKCMSLCMGERQHQVHKAFGQPLIHRFIDHKQTNIQGSSEHLQEEL